MGYARATNGLRRETAGVGRDRLRFDPRPPRLRHRRRKEPWTARGVRETETPLQRRMSHPAARTLTFQNSEPRLETCGSAFACRPYSYRDPPDLNGGIVPPSDQSPSSEAKTSTTERTLDGTRGTRDGNTTST